VRAPEDPTVEPALAALGIESDAILGYGGEARVYALGTDRIARICHSTTLRESVDARTQLLAELAVGADRVPFAIPEVLETREVGGRIVCIERRLPGDVLTAALGRASGAGRIALVRAYLDASSRIADLGLERPWFGELLQREPIRETSYREFLRVRAARSLAGAGQAFGAIDADALVAALPDTSERSLVHVDAFPGNMLAENGKVSAVLDFSVVSIMADRRLDPLASAVYLEPPITPTATADDLAVAREWLRERELDRWFDPARRWLAAFWSVARDDTKLHGWCTKVLLDPIGVDSVASR